MRLFTIALVAVLTFGCARTLQQAPAQVQHMTPTEFKEQRLTKKTVVVDVRTPEEYESGHLDGAMLSDFRGGAFAQDIQNWDKDKVYYLYCASGNRSGKAAELMKEAGFKHIYNLGAFQTLKEAGLPTETGPKEAQ